MSERAAFMPMYWADFLADTSHLDATETGAYLLLIAHYWRVGSLPDNDVQLARIARLSVKQWVPRRAIIEAFFQPGWRHKRIDKELESSSRRIEAKRESGSKGGKAKALKNKDAAVADATNSLEQNDSSRARLLRSPESQPYQNGAAPPSDSPSSTDSQSQTLSLFPPNPDDEENGEKSDKPAREAYPEEFAELWEDYPNPPNGSKLKAFQAWKKLKADAKLDCHEGALRMADYAVSERARRAGWKDPSVPVPHLVTYINQRRWESSQ